MWSLGSIQKIEQIRRETNPSSKEVTEDILRMMKYLNSIRTIIDVTKEDFGLNEKYINCTQSCMKMQLYSNGESFFHAYDLASLCRNEIYEKTEIPLNILIKIRDKEYKECLEKSKKQFMKKLIENGAERDLLLIDIHRP